MPPSGGHQQQLTNQNLTNGQIQFTQRDGDQSVYMPLQRGWSNFTLLGPVAGSICLNGLNGVKALLATNVWI